MVTIENSLTGEYKEAYDRVKWFGYISGFDYADLSRINEGLATKLYEAQQENQPVTTVIGEDEDEFLTEYYSAYTVKDRMKNVFSAANFYLKIGFAYSVIKLFINVIAEGAGLWDVTVGSALVYLASGFIMYICFRNFIFGIIFLRYHAFLRKHKAIYYSLIVAISVAVIALAVAMQALIDGVPALLVIIVIGIYGLICFLFKFILKKGITITESASTKL